MTVVLGPTYASTVLTVTSVVLDAPMAAEVIRQLEPEVVVPMHYKTPALKRELGTVEKFLKEMGIEQIAAQPKLSLTPSSLPVSTQVFLLDY